MYLCMQRYDVRAYLYIQPRIASCAILFPIAHDRLTLLPNICTYLLNRFTAEEKAKRPPLCHMPFGFGPRNCIGMRLALLQAKIALIEMLKRYTFVRAPETVVCVATLKCLVTLM